MHDLIQHCDETEDFNDKNTNLELLEYKMLMTSTNNRCERKKCERKKVRQQKETISSKTFTYCQLVV